MLKQTKKKIFIKKTSKYPLFKDYYTKKYILDKLEKLRNYKTVFLNRNPVTKNLNKFNGKLVIFKEEYKKNKELYNITDYFSQYCRVKCVNNLKSKESPFTYFKKHKKKIFEELADTKDGKNNVGYDDFLEYMYQNTKQCTNFNTTVMMALLKLFKPNRFLDPSAGWGDRLISAIAYGCEYTGVDPSECMNPIYHNIIQELVPSDKRDNYKIIQNGFESTRIEPNYYDLVFTSPPFFDFEVYEKTQNQAQSIEKFNTLELWLKGFLLPLTEKSYNALKIGGDFGIYISDYTGVSFTKEMFKYISENIKGFKYQGDIHFWTPENKKIIRTIFFWKKMH
jgi:hypothetical protein